MEGHTLDVEIADLDGDNDLDIYFANTSSEQNEIFINEGNRVFTKRLIPGDLSASYGVSIGDLNGDGYNDIYVANSSYSNYTISAQNRLWINNGDGTFFSKDIPGDTFNSTGSSLGDLDGDGDLDIYVTNRHFKTYYANPDGQNVIWINDGNATFEKFTIPNDLGSSFNSDMGDVDGDGDLDIYVVNINYQQNYLFINNGDMTFTTTAISGDRDSAMDGKFIDYDNDGDLDIFVTDWLNGKEKLIINDNMNFTIEYLPEDSTRSAKMDIADINHNGFKDIMIAKWQSQENVSVKILINNGGIGFYENNVSENNVSDLDDETNAVKVGDLDGDGNDDFVTANGSYENQKNYILFQ